MHDFSWGAKDGVIFGKLIDEPNCTALEIQTNRFLHFVFFTFALLATKSAMCDVYYGADAVSPAHKDDVIKGIKAL